MWERVGKVGKSGKGGLEETHEAVCGKGEEQGTQQAALIRVVTSAQTHANDSMVPPA